MRIASFRLENLSETYTEVIGCLFFLGLRILLVYSLLSDQTILQAQFLRNPWRHSQDLASRAKK